MLSAKAAAQPVAAQAHLSQRNPTHPDLNHGRLDAYQAGYRWVNG